MSIATAITNAQGKVANAYTAVSGKGGTLPATQDLSNLPTAINSITELKGQTKSITSNGTVTPDSGYNGLTSVTVSVTTTPKVSFAKAVIAGTDIKPYFYDSIKTGSTPPSGAKNASAAYTGNLPAQSTIWWYKTGSSGYSERFYIYYSNNTMTFG